MTDLCPSADFRHKVVDRYAPSGSIAKRLRKVAREEDASIVFIGSENASHLVSAMGSGGLTVATDDAYGVVIVRERKPAQTDKIRDASPQKMKSDCYIPE